MIDWLLKRDAQGAPRCTLGKLAILDFQCETLELAWIPVAGSPGGHPDTSCVPAGVYRLFPHNSDHHPHTWALVNHDLDIYGSPTPGKRDDCLIHTGNKAADVLGCILVGSSRQWIGDQWEVLNSRVTFAHIQTLIPWEEHRLTIVDAPPVPSTQGAL